VTNWLDWLLAVFLLLSALNGWRSGMVRQIVSLVSLFLAYFIAKSFYKLLLPLVSTFIPVPKMAPDNPLRLIPGLDMEGNLHGAIAFLILFVLAFLALRVLGSILDLLAKLPGLSLVNRFAGLVVGFVLAVVVAAIIVNVIALLPYEGVQNAMTHSQLAEVLLRRFEFFVPGFEHV
jgi:uncharacterized membrane protein required for colicin V production